jgi:hypothetical protein
MLRTVQDLLRATSRHPTLFGVAAAILALVAILGVLEISYRQQIAREASLTITGTLQSPTLTTPPKLQLEPDQPRSAAPLGPRIIPLAPPAPQPTRAEASPPPAPAEPAQPQNTATSRDPVPLPRSRPNRF